MKLTTQVLVVGKRPRREETMRHAARRRLPWESGYSRVDPNPFKDLTLVYATGPRRDHGNMSQWEHGRLYWIESPPSAGGSLIVTDDD